MTQTVSRHRRSRRFGWILLAGGVALVVAAGAGAVVLNSTNDSCDDPITLNVATSPDQFPVVNQLADRWNSNGPADTVHCGRISVQAMPSNFGAATLSPVWDEQQDGPRPDVWVPDSSIWLTVAAGRPDAGGMLPEGPPPSLASSPVVLAMQQPMAEALGWPDRELGWADLLGAFAGGQTWEQFGHAEWGRLQLGIADPTRSTAGLAGVLSMLDLDGDNALSDQELISGVTFSQMVTAYEENTDALLRSYAGGGGGAQAQALPAGFPVLERDLAAHAAGEPAVPLVPLYLREGTVFADYPYAVLQAPWVDQERRQLAGEFLAHLQSPAGRQAYAQAGFRDPAHAVAGAPLLASERGFQPELGAPVRQPTPEALGELLGMWPMLTRENNVLVALDTSGSMNDQVPGTDLTRLQLLQQAAVEGIALLTNQTLVGLWEFSTGLTPTTPYRELVPVGPAGEQLDGGDRRQAMVAAIQGLQADGGTGLYDTVHDAYLQAQQSWQPNAQNMLVVITDGKDEDHPGRTLPELLGALEEHVDADRPLPTIAVAVGPEADAAALEQITQVTGGRTIVARDEVSAIQQVVLAFSGRIS